MRKKAKGIFVKFLIRLCQWAGLTIAGPDEQVVPAGATLLPAGFSMFEDQLAAEIGLHQAIVVQKIAGWAAYNQRKGSSQHYHDGRWWTYGSLAFWQQQMCWWSEPTVKRHFADLERDGWLLIQPQGVRGNQPRSYSPSDKLIQRGVKTESKANSLSKGGYKLSKRDSVFTPYNNKYSSLNPSGSASVTTTTPAPARMDAPEPLPAPVVVVSSTPFQEVDWLASSADREADDRRFDEGRDDIPAIPDPSPVPPAPSPAGVPEWARTFFTGCTDDELKRLFDAHGEQALRQGMERARSMDGIRNPAGFARWALRALGQVPGGTKRELTGADYISGPYAAFIER